MSARRGGGTGPAVLAVLACACLGAEPPPLPETIEVEGATLVASGDRVLTAERATVDGSRVTTEAVRVAEGAILEVRAKRSDWDLQQGTATFSGEVVAVRRDVELRCDRLAVTIDRSGAIQTAEATGNLRLKTGTREARAERATLDVRSGELVLTGAPELRDGDRALTGDRIVVELDGGKASCEGDPCRLTVPETALSAPGAGR